MRALIFLVVGAIMLAAPVLAQETSYEKALAAYAKKDFKAAVEYLKEYVEQEPNAKAYYLLGYASYKIKNFDESAGYFKEVYLLDPGFDPKTIKFDTE